MHVIITVNSTVVCGIPLLQVIRHLPVYFFNTTFLAKLIINEDCLPVELCR